MMNQGLDKEDEWIPRENAFERSGLDEGCNQKWTVSIDFQYKSWIKNDDN